MAEQAAVDPILIKRARAAQWACGLCLALLFLLGLSGIASITLLHDDQLYVGNTGGLEGSVLDTVMDLRWLIEPVHEWGGYLAIVLGGWAGLALWRFARHIRRSDRAEWRRTGAWLGPCGLLAGLLVVASVLLLIASGVAASGFVDHIASRHDDDLAGLDKSTGLIDAREALAGYADSQYAELHVRELNYLLAAAALIMVMGAAASRRVALEARQTPDSPEE